ncbi:MAG TPA: hypothetical protein VFB58_13710 [Chloroflexota bacterium]|nr:hypothetical protein [Chloroflexota bacterium]
MSQEFQSIGSCSPELEQIAAQRQGWSSDTPEPPIEEQTSRDYSFRDDRANDQLLHRIVPNIAGYDQTPAAAIPVTPFDSFRPEELS